MPAPLHDVCCASLPPESLAALAAVRELTEVRVALAAGRAWVRWEPGEERVLRAVLPVSGVELYVRRDGRWHRHGHHLPAFDFPAQLDERPVHQVLTPAPVRPVPPPSVQPRPIALALVADARPRPGSAMRCGVLELARWADTVPAARLAALRAGQCEGRVLLLGTRLPPLARGERFWGGQLLVPLGRRPDPDLPASAVREALGIAADEVLLLTDAGAEVVPTSAFRPLTRAQVRLAAGEVAP
jgi:hypothetical protein